MTLPLIVKHSWIGEGCLLKLPEAVFCTYAIWKGKKGMVCFVKKPSKRFNLPLQFSKQVLEVPIFNAVSIKDCNYEVEWLISQVIWKWRHRNGTKSFGGRAFWGPILSLSLQTPVCPFGTALIRSFDNGSITRLQIKATGHKIWKDTNPFFLSFFLTVMFYWNFVLSAMPSAAKKKVTNAPFCFFFFFFVGSSWLILFVWMLCWVFVPI